MLKAALIGVGCMGRGHLDNFMRFKKDGTPIDLIAVCDVDSGKFSNFKTDFNIADVGNGTYDFDAFKCYTDLDEMLAAEKGRLDMVAIALPTYLHCDIACKCLNAGLHVFCEKPMALNARQCSEMIETAEKNGKKLMIGQCLRFWGEYEVLKRIVDDGSFGKPVAGYFFRGGGTPLWSWNNWLLKRECGGGALIDQHVHDVDMINYLFGLPEAVSSLGYVIIEGSGYDTVTTNYIYPSHMAVNAQDDWVLSGGGFGMIFRVNFERGTVSWDNAGFRVAPKDGTEYVPEYDRESAYYKEMVYFADCILRDLPLTKNPPEASRDTIRLIDAEVKSADSGGAVVRVE